MHASLSKGWYASFYYQISDCTSENERNQINKAERKSVIRIQKGKYGNKYNNNLLYMTTLRKYGILSNSCSYE